MNHYQQNILRIGRWGTLLTLATAITFASLSRAEDSPAAGVFHLTPDRENDALPADATLSGETLAPSSAMSWWYRTPATKFWEGLPLGNGRFAAMVYGRVRDEMVDDDGADDGQAHAVVRGRGK